jgi:hypothetical protein
VRLFLGDVRVTGFRNGGAETREPAAVWKAAFSPTSLPILPKQSPGRAVVPFSVPVPTVPTSLARPLTADAYPVKASRSTLRPCSAM